MALTEYTETIGPVRFGTGGVLFYDYDLSKRANITIKSANCVWIGTAPISEVHAATEYHAAIIDPGHGNLYGSSTASGGASTGGGGSRACSTVSAPGNATSVGTGSYSISNPGGNSYGGTCGNGTTLCTATPTQYRPYPTQQPNFWMYYTCTVSWSIPFQYLTEAGHGNITVRPAFYDVPGHPEGTAAHTHTYYSTPTKVQVGSVDAATFTQGGSIAEGVSSNSYAISAGLIKPGSINRINTGAIGGNGSTLFQLTVVYTMNTPSPVHYLSYLNSAGKVVLLPLCELTDPQLYTTKLRVRAHDKTLCADLIPTTGNDHTGWSGVKVCMPTPTGSEVLVWRKAT